VKHWFKLSIITAALAIAPISTVAAQTADRDTRPTADNQKNDKPDIKITADIRKSIIDDKTLSTNAHNVKIITRGGAVTVRGRVNSDDERKSVISKAEEVAGHGNVTDELKLSAAKMKSSTN
jgi:osmotically-inducible protein OsmY